MGWPAYRIAAVGGTETGQSNPGAWCRERPHRLPSRSRARRRRRQDPARSRRDYQELKQEVGLGHFEGRGWRGFHHHATLCIAAYGFLIAERETIPPSGPRSTTLFPELAVPDGYRPRGSPATARASHPKLDRNHAPTIDRRARQEPATMSVLQLCNRKTVTAHKFMTQ